VDHLRQQVVLEVSRHGECQRSNNNRCQHLRMKQPEQECNRILAGLPKCLVLQLQRVQNAAAKLIFGLRPRDHVTSVLQHLYWLPVYYRIQFKLCLLMYSACYQHCLAYISNVVQSVATSTHRQGLRSSTCPTYVVPRTRTKLEERAFSLSGPVAWNTLPANIRSTADLKLFKPLLKIHFSISRLISLRNVY